MIILSGENYNRQTEVDELIDENIFIGPQSTDEEYPLENPNDPKEYLTCNMFDFDNLISRFLLELRTNTSQPQKPHALLVKKSLRH